jgi:hypothetical protein
MASTKVQLIGGAFQDCAGNALANGYLLFVLSQDGVVNGSTQIASGREIKISLDSNGNVVTSPAQYLWPNDVIIPSDTFYTVSGYTSAGQLVWGPNAQQVLSSPSPYSISAWIPGTVNQLQGNVITYDIGVFFVGEYTGSQVILLLPLERKVQFAPAFTPSVAACGVNPTATATFTINQNGSPVGTITFTTNGVATFTSASGATFSIGDVLTIVGQATPDVTLANVGIVLSGVVV